MEYEIIQKRVMRRVRFIAFCKRLYRPTIIRLALFAVLLGVGSVYVSVSHVLANMSGLSSVTEQIAYLAHAFIYSEFLLQASLSGIIALLVWAIADQIREKQYHLPV